MLKVNPIERPDTLKELAYRKIKDHIVGGQLQSATTYSANQFAEMLGVSRTPVREALLQLAAEGFLGFIEGRGFQIKQHSPKEIEDFFETRRLIEAHVVGQLVGTLSPDDLRALERNLKLMTGFAEKRDADAFLETDKEFHMSLVHRHNNLLLTSIMDRIGNHIAIFGLKALSHEGRMHQVVLEHGGILQAFHRREKERAVQAMLDHLVTTERFVLHKTEKP